MEGGRRVIYSNRKITSQSKCADVQRQPNGGVERRLCRVGKHLLEEVTDELLEVRRNTAGDGSRESKGQREETLTCSKKNRQGQDEAGPYKPS